jgi:hypothetical protein
MADEVQGSVTNGNGERLQFQVGTKTFGIQARDLIPVLLLIMIGVGGYLLYLNMATRMDWMMQRQDQTQEMLHANQLKMVEALQTWHQILKTQEDAIRITLLHQNELLEHQTETFRRFFYTHDYNQGRPPEDRLPLDLTPPATGR